MKVCCCAHVFSSGWAGAALYWGAQASHCRAQALDAQASVVDALRFSSCGTWALLLRGIWNLPRPGFKTSPSALAGEFLSPVPPGKSMHPIKFFYVSSQLLLPFPTAATTNLHSLHSTDQPTLLASYLMEITWYSLTFSHPCLATCLYLLTQYFYPVISENYEHCLLSFCLGCCHYTHLNII